MKLLYQLYKTIIVSLIPLLLVLTSMSLALADANVHKKTLTDDGFYDKLSFYLKQSVAPVNPKPDVESVVTNSFITQLATPSWLQSVAEKNIDLLTGWVRGDQSNISVYIPTDDINTSVKNNIDGTVSDILKKDKSSVRQCRPDEVSSIKSNGYKAGQDNFCLPAEVLNGSLGVSSYLNLNGSPNSLDTLLQNNPIASISGTKTSAEQIQLEINNKLNGLRNFFRVINGLSILIIFGVVLFLAVAGIVSYLTRQKTIAELRKLLWLSGLGTLLLSGTIVLMLGGLAYLSQFVQGFIFPSLITNQIQSLVAWEVVRFSFNLVLLAVYAGIALIVCSFLTLLIKYIPIERNVKKNSKLDSHKPDYQNTTTFDSEFKKNKSTPLLSPPIEATPLPTSPTEPEQLYNTNTMPNQFNAFNDSHFSDEVYASSDYFGEQSTPSASYGYSAGNFNDGYGSGEEPVNYVQSINESTAEYLAPEPRPTVSFAGIISTRQDVKRVQGL